MNEVTIPLNVNANNPLYEQIYEYLKSEIQSGKISSDEKLPSTRALAKHLQVSRATVDLSYEQLVSEGYIHSVPCKGYYVCRVDGLYRIVRHELKEEQLKQESQSNIRYDFTPNGIELNSFPFNAWRKVTKNILIDDKKELFQIGSPLGEPSLRYTISRYLHQARGVNCSPDQIILGAGNDYLLMLLSSIMGRDYIIAMENPTYRPAYHTFINMGYRICPISVDEQGIRIEELEKSEADIAYVMPSHQFPLGIVMPIKRRIELLEWASAKEGRFIIEDDYDSEFRYKGKPIPSLQGNDNNETVIYIGTFSKSIAPAIRVSYMVLPEPLMKKYSERGKLYSSTVSRIDQEILNCFIQEGYYERHLNKMRGIYKAKHDTLLAELKSLKKYIEVSGENAGVHALLHCNLKMTEEELVQKALKEGVRIYGLSDYYIKEVEKKETVLLLGYATLSEPDIISAVAALKRAWEI